MVKDKTVESEQKLSENLEKDKKDTKKSFTILGIPIIKLFTYFIIYSIIGFVLETIFALITKGTIESRKSFLYGPFCAIYGLGATSMIVGLQKFNKNNYTLFFGGCLIGSIVEYLVSWIGEMVFDVKWWDYSTMPFNINGRICLWFTIFWGILAVYLMRQVNPLIDKLLDKLPERIVKILTIILSIFMFADWMISSFAVQMFYVRIVNEKNIELKQANVSSDIYIKLYENPTVKEIVDEVFSNETIIKSFPNLKLTDKNGEIILVHTLFPNIDPYYIKVFTPKYPKIDLNLNYDEN